MRSLISFVCCLLVAGSVYAQNYAPFNATVSKRFYEVNNPAADDYFFYADSVHDFILQATYFQYHGWHAVSPYQTPVCDQPWMMVERELDTNWLGNQVIYASWSKKMEVYNHAGDTLRFNFLLPLGDSALFYQDSAGTYYIQNIGQQEENIFSQEEMVKRFKVLHYDSVGMPVNSPLHGFELAIAQNLGILSFFDSYHFPQVEKPLALKGQLYPLLGSYHMTEAELYADWQPGNTFQFYGTYHTPYGFSSKKWSTYTVIDRIETGNTVTLHLEESSYMTHNFPPNYGSTPSYCITLPNPLVLHKDLDILAMPVNRVENSHEVFNGEMESLFCGNRYGIYTENPLLRYCDECRCYRSGGEFQGYHSSFVKRAKGLGVLGMHESEYMPQLWWRESSLVYCNLSGTECGVYNTAGVADELGPPRLLPYPNPATGVLWLGDTYDGVEVYNLQGIKINKGSVDVNFLDLATLPSGVYVLRLQKGAGISHVQFVKVDP